MAWNLVSYEFSYKVVFQYSDHFPVFVFRYVLRKCVCSSSNVFTYFYKNKSCVHATVVHPADVQRSREMYHGSGEELKAKPCNNRNIHRQGWDLLKNKSIRPLCLNRLNQLGYRLVV